VIIVCSFIFFFSSRRRHTRFSRDWSSDVCSSDLLGVGGHFERWGFPPERIVEKDWYERAELEDGFVVHVEPARHFSGRGFYRNRSEERRVGKECRAWWWSYQ